MRFEIFTDPLYNGETFVEFDPDDVVEAEEKTIKLFLRGRHRVTEIRLKSGAKHLLIGEVKAQIENGQNSHG